MYCPLKSSFERYGRRGRSSAFACLRFFGSRGGVYLCGLIRLSELPVRRLARGTVQDLLDEERGT